jgi:cytochrome c553
VTSASPPAEPSAPPAAAAKAGETWSNDWSKDRQIAFMKANVTPSLGKVFKSHDEAQYAGFSCKTCHGPAYKNPHEFLPKLALKDGKLTAFADKPEVSKFMAESVVPAMAAAMGEPEYDPKTQKGFGCGGCHGIEKKN